MAAAQLRLAAAYGRTLPQPDQKCDPQELEDALMHRRPYPEIISLLHRLPADAFMEDPDGHGIAARAIARLDRTKVEDPQQGDITALSVFLRQTQSLHRAAGPITLNRAIYERLILEAGLHVQRQNKPIPGECIALVNALA